MVFGEGFPWSTVKTSRRGASGIVDLLAGVNTFEKTGLGAFSPIRRVEGGAVSLTESTVLGVVNGVLCCSGSIKGVNYKLWITEN